MIPRFPLTQKWIEYIRLLSRHTLKLSQHDIPSACNIFPENAAVRNAGDDGTMVPVSKLKYTRQKEAQ